MISFIAATRATISVQTQCRFYRFAFMHYRFLPTLEKVSLRSKYHTQYEPIKSFFRAIRIERFDKADNDRRSYDAIVRE